MLQIGRSFALALLCWGYMHAQEKPIAIGPGVTPPQVSRKVDPAYNRQAVKDHIQGTVLLHLVVTTEGRPSDISVVSPLGHGLDEEAIAAVEKWKFKPGIRNGEPVAVRATIEVNFNLTNVTFDQGYEKQRTRFNSALQTLREAPAESPATMRALKDMQSLADQEFPPAMYLVGQWEIKGSGVAKSPVVGLSRIQRAAAKHYAPALYNLAVREIEGQDVPADPKHGINLMQQAADGGSTDAQSYLGETYQNGKGVAVQPKLARRYFRLCAAHGNATCQYHLGTMLMDTPEGAEGDRVQAIAWLELAGATLPEAREIAAREAATLTPDQNRAVSSLKSRLVHK